MESPSRSPLHVPWKTRDGVLATASVFAGFIAIQYLLALAIGVAGVNETAFRTPWVLGMLEGLMLVAVWVFGIRKYGVPWRTVGLRRPLGRWSLALPWVALLASLLLTGAYAAIIRGLGQEALLPPPVPQDVLGTGATRLLNVLVVVIWGPFAEEIFFRGYLLAALVSPIGARRATVVSAAIFAVAHLVVGAMIPIFFTGLLLGWLYLRTRSIWPPLAAHAAQNLIAISVAA